MDPSLHSTLSISSLEKWNIDYIGLIVPMSSKHNQYIIIAVEYLTEWVEAMEIKVADAKYTAIFFYENIISCSSYPLFLVSNKGTHFLNKTIEKITNLFQINHWKTTSYHLQINGLAKRINQTLVHIL